MVKLLKPGRVVVVTAGRFAGKKGVVLAAYDTNKDKTFGHAIVAGIRTPPRKVHKRMNQRRIEKRCRVKVFVKALNFNHVMPTRYTVSSDFDLNAINEQVIAARKDVDERKRDMKSAGKRDEKEAQTLQLEIANYRKTLRSNIQKLFQEKFMNPVNEKSKKVSKDVLFLRKKLRF